ncbi:Uncharacterized protein dnm_040680 [Desulfonema magnum]|uniref:Uncharacterized protein n=1 Tax=Desulfonema magnum TaxID=45655 RepID=A0A975BM63_9BACT|nr:Uncharacterized protein dnm_040680 [Desulfonema magnum]
MSWEACLFGNNAIMKSLPVILLNVLIRPEPFGLLIVFLRITVH